MKKILFIFLLVAGMFLTGCGSAADTTIKDDDPIEQNDPGVTPITTDDDFTININSSVVGTLGSGDVHTYTVTLPSNGRITAYLESDFDSYGSILDSIGEVTIENDDSPSGDDFRIDNFTMAAGTYIIEIKGANTSHYGDYTLHVTFEEIAPPSLIDETFTIDLNSNVTGILGGGDLHSYTFTVPSDGNITTYLVSDFDSYGAIINSLGVVLRYNDDATYNNENFKIENFAMSAGTYSVYVEGYDLNEYGNYTLYVTFEESVTPTTTDEDFTMDLNSSVVGTLGTGNVHTYTITLSSNGSITTYLESEFDSYGSILDSIGEIIIENDDATSGDDFRIDNLTLAAGTYIIEIKGINTNHYGDYTLYVMFEESVAPTTVDETFTIELNSNVTGTIGSGNINSYIFTIPSNGYVTAYLVSGFNSRGDIIDSYGIPLYIGITLPGTDDFRIESLGLVAGTYTIEIKGFDESEYGDYTLYITYEAG